MAVINDSDAYLNKDRLLAQHQAALSLLQGRLDRPGIIITTSEFTSSAKEFANSLNKEIELWDINYLLQNI